MMHELRKNRTVLALLLAGLLAAGTIYFLFMPGRSQLAQLQAENASLQLEIDGLTRFLRSAESTNHFAATLGGERTATLNELYGIDSLESFIDDFAASLEAMGMSNVHIVPLIDDLLAPPIVELDGVKLAQIKFAVEAGGEFIAGGMALEQIEKQRYYVAMPGLSIEHDDGISPEVAWNFVLQAHFRTGGGNGS
jgi:hypothetical protein